MTDPLRPDYSVVESMTMLSDWLGQSPLRAGLVAAWRAEQLRQVNELLLLRYAGFPTPQPAESVS
jgi:hypothetical protein